jgi:hypothetical protein
MTASIDSKIIATSKLPWIRKGRYSGKNSVNSGVNAYFMFCQSDILLAGRVGPVSTCNSYIGITIGIPRHAQPIRKVVELTILL